jgi:hypothetical protein
VSILFRLFLLVAIALLPVIAIEAYNQVALSRSRQVEAQDQALAMAKLTFGGAAAIHRGDSPDPDRPVAIRRDKVEGYSGMQRLSCRDQRALSGIPLFFRHRHGR